MGVEVRDELHGQIMSLVDKQMFLLLFCFQLLPSAEVAAFLMHDLQLLNLVCCLVFLFSFRIYSPLVSTKSMHVVYMAG